MGNAAGTPLWSQEDKDKIKKRAKNVMSRGVSLKGTAFEVTPKASNPVSSVVPSPEAQKLLTHNDTKTLIAQGGKWVQDNPVSQSPVVPAAQPVGAPAPDPVLPSVTSNQVVPERIVGTGVETDPYRNIGGPQVLPRKPITDAENLAIINKGHEDTAIAQDQLARNNVLRNAADALQRAYNQPTRQNLKAAQIAHKVFQDAGISDVAYKKMVSGQGLSDAEMQKELAQADLMKKQAEILPSSYEESIKPPKITFKDMVDAAKTDSADDLGNKTSSIDEEKLDRLVKKYIEKIVSGKGGESSHQLTGQKAGIYEIDGNRVKWDGNREIQ